MAPLIPSTNSAANPATAPRPRVLIVDDEPALLETVRDVVSRSVHCRMISANNLDEARKILATQSIELLVLDVNLPDGDGMSLLPTLRKQQPHASAIVITGAPSVDGAISALRSGALDFVPKPFSAEQITERVRRALERQALIAKNERRLTRLKTAVRRLNDSRKLVSKKVDLLCNDLISAYGELSRQLDVVRTQEGFRKFLAQAKDLEQLLCHMMDWILRQLGYCNVGIWLASSDKEYELGAYMKYTIAGEPGLTDALKAGVVRLATRDGFLHLRGDEVQERLQPAELDYLADQEIVAMNCTYLAESLATVVLFRDAKDGFSEDDLATLKSISPLFAIALASMVRGSQNEDGDEEENWEGDSLTDGGLHNTDDEEDTHDDIKPKKKKKRDSADWWKHGEEPPF